MQALASQVNNVFLLGLRPQDRRSPPPHRRGYHRLLHASYREDDEGLLIVGRS